MQVPGNGLLDQLNKKLRSVAGFVPEENSEEGKKNLGRVLSQWLLPFIFLAWFVFLSFSSPVFLTWDNLFNITRQVAVIGILSMGQLICMLTGNIDLSVGTFLGLFGALLAGLSLQMGFVPALIICLIGAVVWGLINGFLVTRGEGISVIVTLSMMYVARGITLIYTQGRPIVGFPMPFEFLGAGNLGPVPYNLIVFAAISLVTWFVLQKMRLGRHLYAIGGNKQSAKVSGINTHRLTIGVFVTTALLSSLGAIILLGRVASAQPTAGYGMELDSIATVLIGGASVSGGYGGVVTTLIGILMLGLINNGLNLLGISGYWQFVFKGAIILTAVMVDTMRQKK